MRNITRLSAVLISLLFAGCGGGGGGGSTPVVTTPFSTISGNISDGPINKAKVCLLDVSADIEYCPAYTDANGNYSFQYILENGKQYLVVAYGSLSSYGTTDTKDNAGSDMEFMMFEPVKVSGSIISTENIGSSYKVDINPISYKQTLTEYYPQIQSSITDTTLKTQIESIVNDLNNTTNTAIFQNLIVGAEKTTNLTTVLTSYVQPYVETVNNTALSTATTTTTTEITATSLKEQLVQGNLQNDTYGIADLINTKIAYEVIQNALNNTTSAYSTWSKTVNAQGYIVVNFVKSESVATSADNHTAKYTGTVMFDSSGNLIDANYYQEFTLNDTAGKNIVNGYVKIEADGSFDFSKGQFTLQTSNYGQVGGYVTVSNGATSKNLINGAFENNNVIELSDAVLKVSVLPQLKTIPSDFIGLWNGTTTTTSGTCPSGLISMGIYVSNQSWNGSDNNNYWGTTIKFDTQTSLTMYNSTQIWSSNATINSNKDTISGNWQASNCSGTFSVSKQ